MRPNFYMLNLKKVLLIAEVLHQKGYQNLKIIPSLSPSGVYWRCSFETSYKGLKFDIIASNWLQDFWSISESEIKLDIHKLTNKFIEEHKVFLEKCKGENEEYSKWFKDAVEILDEEELPYAFSDYFGPTTYWKTSLGKKIYLDESEAVLYPCDANDQFEYSKIEQVIRSFYKDNGYEKDFKNDLLYLQNSFEEINSLWLKNLNSIDTINYVMIAEAPLWGKEKKYIYNPATKLSQFFYKSDLECVLRIYIDDKKEFLKICNSIGLLIIDISPFALNKKDTKLNYQRLGNKNYKKLVQATLPLYFDKKIDIIKPRLSEDVKIFFRYKRVKENFENIIGETLLDKKIISSLEEIEDISQKGGGINKSKLKEIISNKYYG